MWKLRPNSPAKQSECSCCKELDGCVDALNSEFVLQDIHAVPAGMFMLPVSSFSTSSCVSSIYVFVFF